VCPVTVVIPVDDSPNELIVGCGKEVLCVKWNADYNLEVPGYILMSKLTSDNIRTNDGKADSAGRLWIGKLKIYYK